MVSNWPMVKIGDYCSKIGSGATPRGGSSVYQASGEICLVRSQNIYNSRFKFDGLVYIDEAAAAKLKNVVLETNDILLNITGDSVARVCLVDDRVLPARVNQHVAIIRPIPSEFDARFLRYYLTSPYAQTLLLNLASAGATRNALTKSMIENFEVPKPALEVQSSIADQLEALELKIRSNQETNQTIEQIAQVLFKSWFVDFDPVFDNALASGIAINDFPEALQKKAEQRQQVQQQIANGELEAKPLPEEIQQLFPSEFEQTDEPSIGINGWIPKGWAINEIKQLCEKVQNGGTPRRNIEEFWEDGTIPWLTSGEVRQSLIVEVENTITELGLDKSSAKWIPKYSTLVALYGATAGEVAINSFPLTSNQAVCSLIPKESYEWFNYLTISLRVSEFQGKAVGSAQQNISKGLVETTTVVVPPIDIIDCFNIYIKPYFLSRVAKNTSSLNLANIRDTLLPKLISGELTIPKAKDCA